jgi:type IV pilus modification protein PilV
MKTAYRMRPQEQGFGMIEVLVSLLLMVIAAVGGLALLASTLYANQFAANAQTASRLGQEIIDRMVAEPFATVGTAGTCATNCSNCEAATGCTWSTPLGMAPVYANSTNQPGPGARVPFTRNCCIQPLLNGIKIMNVRVSWTDTQIVEADGTARVRSVRVGAQRAP